MALRSPTVPRGEYLARFALRRNIGRKNLAVVA